jgi:tRNA (adenine22-N1)-methyltransferase
MPGISLSKENKQMTFLNERLAMVAEMIGTGKSVADIGADHARLATYLVESKIAPKVIIGELSDGPYNRSYEAVMGCSDRDKIEVRQGNGLQVLERGEVDCVVLAGMGGDTIVDILSHDWDKAASFKYYVFQPMSKAEVLRQRLASRGWIINNERLVQEHDHIYLGITSRPGNCPYYLHGLDLELGAFILKADNETKKIYIARYLQKCQRIYRELLLSSLHRNRVLADEYREKITILEEALYASQG